jgi:serine/threonine protein kinase
MPVAIKLIYKRKTEGKPFPTPAKDIPNEVIVLQKFKHKGIIRFVEWFECLHSFYLVTERVEANWTESIYTRDEVDPSEECMAILTRNGRMRLAVRSGGSDLFSFIDLNVSVPSSQRQDIFSGIARSIGYMHHQHSTTHGDIKGMFSRSHTIQRKISCSLMISSQNSVISGIRDHARGRLTARMRRRLRFMGPRI